MRNYAIVGIEPRKQKKVERPPSDEAPFSALLFKILTDPYVDQLAFFTGKQKKSNRDGFIIYNNDDVYGYKWRNWKMHLIELENMNSEPMRLNVPRIYNLITDPKEEYNMASEATWVLPVMFEKIIAFQKTFIQEPPISLGTPDPYDPE